MKFKQLYFILFFWTVLFLPNTQATFLDIENSQFIKAITYLSGKNIIEGYDDQTFKPSNSINRAEFLKILIKAKKENYDDLAGDYRYQCFNDIAIDRWYTPYVCYAKKYQIINGYPDGSFRPGNNIKLAEALKIFVNIFEIPQNRQGEQWFESYLYAMADNHYIPDTLYNLSQRVTRGEMAEMTWRVMAKVVNLSSVNPEDLINPKCQLFEYSPPNNIDYEKVKSTWLEWYNAERLKTGKEPYVYNAHLDKTATIWSQYAKSRGYMDHKRPGQSLYYDYGVMLSWFKGYDLVFKNVNSITFTENIGWGPYNCQENDCTEQLLEAINYTFQFFINEKYSNNQVHYLSLISDKFQEIGFGLALGDGKYYLTVHYGTEIISDPLPICSE